MSAISDYYFSVVEHIVRRLDELSLSRIVSFWDFVAHYLYICPFIIKQIKSLNLMALKTILLLLMGFVLLKGEIVPFSKEVSDRIFNHCNELST